MDPVSNDVAHPSLEVVTPCSKSFLPSSAISLEKFSGICSGNLKLQQIKELDAYFVDDILSAEECDSLVEQTNALEAYTFWNSSDSTDKTKAFRDAVTIEVMHPELSKVLFDRLKPLLDELNLSQIEISDEKGINLHRSQRDLQGIWDAYNTNERVLFAKYGVTGHFSPHTDGFDIRTFDDRSMYSIVLFLNSTPAGGGTRFFKEEAKGNLIFDEATGCFMGKPEHIELTVESKQGRCIIFFHNILHEGVRVELGEKYIIRSDVMYRRREPLLQKVEDQLAYAMYEKALDLSESAKSPADFEAITKLFRTAFKRSPILAKIYGM